MYTNIYQVPSFNVMDRLDARYCRHKPTKAVFMNVHACAPLRMYVSCEMQYFLSLNSNRVGIFKIPKLLVGLDSPFFGLSFVKIWLVFHGSHQKGIYFTDELCNVVIVVAVITGNLIAFAERERKRKNAA